MKHRPAALPPKEADSKMGRAVRGAGLVLAALVVAGLFGGVAGAKGPSLLTLKTAKGELAVGQEVVADSTNLVFETSSGNLECSSNILKGKLAKNNSKKDEGPIESESSTGNEPGGLCKTTTPLGATEIKTSNLPWSTVLSSKGVDEVKGKKVSFTSVFPNSGATCVFEAAKVKSTFTPGGPVTIVTSKQKFKLNKKASTPVCPKEGTLSGTFTGTSNGETVESELT